MCALRIKRKIVRILIILLPACVLVGGVWVAGDCTRFALTEPLGETPAGAASADSGVGQVRNVLLVHGIFDSSNKFRYLGRRLEERGFRVVAIDLEPSGARDGLDPLAKQVAGLVEAEFGNEPFALVGYSMGGLVCRAYLQKLAGTESALVGSATISTPHHGSLWGWLHPSQGAREMRPGSEWMTDLNRDPVAIRNRPFLSLWSPLDLMIVPSWSSQTDYGKESLHWVPAHPLMLFNPGVADRLGDFLEGAFAGVEDRPE